MDIWGSPTRNVVYVSHVHGMYIYQGDIVIDTDAEQSQGHLKTLAAAKTGESTLYNAAASISRSTKAQFKSEYGETKAKAILDSIGTNAFFLPTNTNRGTTTGVYLPPDSGAAGYAYTPSTGVQPGVYLPAINARWPNAPIPYCISQGIPICGLTLSKRFQLGAQTPGWCSLRKHQQHVASMTRTGRYLA